MVNNLTVAWATPVDADELGACIEAHAVVKATMSAFRKFIKNTRQVIAAKQLAPELLDIISSHVRQSAYEESIKEWHTIWLCFHGCCDPSDHLSEKDYQSLHALCLSELDELTAEEREDYFETWLWERRSITRSDDEHDDNIDNLERKIRESPDRRRDDKKFANLRKVALTVHILDV